MISVTFEDFCGQERIGIREEPLPFGMYGFTKRTSDGYVIILNAAADDQRKQAALGHELAHIINDHLDLLQSELAERAVRDGVADLLFE
ncbi:ImmA/IrrE family metallo-endopeptidase [Faecalibaculum rodentium]|uniref:ImmA/IrrE family metallo-endopeptidase n=1 Tax=Faecalibaculum rodentium TaxID=1702221 RepID=UPI0023F0A894|nr:ImmA/IrrE family metallo-endopeptidase [Faecalibaculum rodentium]